MTIKNEVGKRYGEWIVISLARVHPVRGAYWSCRCSCGTETEVLGSALRSGHSQSCGCRWAGRPRRTGRTHQPIAAPGGIIAPEYVAWQNMLQRCENPRNPKYKCYGARGITVCERWHRFNAFYEDMGPRPSPELTLERIDNNANYEPSNCRWATWTEQYANRRPREKDPLSIESLARSIGLSSSTVLKRLEKGWTLDEALHTQRWAHEPFGTTLTTLARSAGMSRQLLEHRLRIQGLSLEEALTRPIRRYAPQRK